MFKFPVFFGQYPFNTEIGSIMMPNDNRDAALQRALIEYRGVIPDGVLIEEKTYPQYHPVIGQPIRVQ